MRASLSLSRAIGLYNWGSDKALWKNEFWQVICGGRPGETFSRNLNRWSDKCLQEAAEEEFGENSGGISAIISAGGRGLGGLCTLEQKLLTALLNSSLLSLKSWISQSPHLRHACTEESFLATFLRCHLINAKTTTKSLNHNWYTHTQGLQVQSGENKREAWQFPCY